MTERNGIWWRNLGRKARAAYPGWAQRSGDFSGRS